jgi:uncharacterized Tic20 family protein
LSAVGYQLFSHQPRQELIAPRITDRFLLEIHDSIVHINDWSPMEQTATGRLRDTGVSATDRNTAMWLHLTPAMGFFILGPLAIGIPLFIWLAKKDASSFVDDHGREVLNMSITGAILFVISAMTVLLMPLWLIWAIVALIGVIRGATAASDGAFFRYPMTIRFM